MFGNVARMRRSARAIHVSTFAASVGTSSPSHESITSSAIAHAMRYPSQSGLWCLKRFEAGDDVVVLGLSTETIRPVSTGSTGVAFIALGTLGTISAGIALIALSGLSEASSLNTIQFSGSDRGATRLTVHPLIGLKRHIQLPPVGNVESPGNVDSPGAVIPPNQPRQRASRSEHRRGR